MLATKHFNNQTKQHCRAFLVCWLTMTSVKVMRTFDSCTSKLAVMNFRETIATKDINTNTQETST